MLSEYHTHKKLNDIDIYVGPFTTVAVKDGLSAHGNNIRDAINDLNFKILQQTTDVTELVKEIKSKGTINVDEYRLLTGACKYGVNSFLKEKNLTLDTELSIKEVKELTINRYGNNKINELF